MHAKSDRYFEIKDRTMDKRDFGKSHFDCSICAKSQVKGE